ncbi:MAG: GNAT family N-acetyltransferase [Acidobacteria bacterium]|nr:GNAT family N-acetyltransferase [Acidobacteriota bacterium]
MNDIITTNDDRIILRFATADDVALIIDFIRQLADYEKLTHEMVADEDLLRQSLFGERRVAEVVIATFEGEAAGFALFFHNFSTFLGRPGIYLEDLFVIPKLRGCGIGRAMLSRLAEIAVERGCGRLEWWVLDWNVDAISFYERLGAQAMDEWTVFRVAGDALQELAQLST